MITQEDIRIAACEVDFIKTLEESCSVMGGGSWKSFKHMTLEEVMRTAARNGLRFIAGEAYHMEDVEPLNAEQAAAVCNHLKSYPPPTK